jgi:hypothetical protein
VQALALALGLLAGPPPPSFQYAYEIAPLLVRHGCASAYCHGSATGRGGFKLSLFGGEPRADHIAIAEDLDGRRLDLIHPEESLLLKKPSRAIRHGGGRVISEAGETYSALRRWIESGAPYERGEPLRLEGLRLERAAEKGGRGPAPRLRALASFADGRGRRLDRDVSELAVWRSSDDRILAADQQGNLERRGPGAAWVFARYGHLDAWAEVVQPYEPYEGLCGRRPAPPRLHANEIDAAFEARLAELGLEAAEEAPPHVLVRRLHLDLAGRPPAPREVEAFLALPEAERVEATARRLMALPAFSELFAEHFAGWFETPEELKARIASALAAGRSVSSIAASLLGGAEEDWRLLRRPSDPRDRAELVGRAFLGIRIGCARCHDHPLDRWTQSDHLSFSACFADPRPEPGGAMREGLFFHPESGEVVPPRLLSFHPPLPPEGGGVLTPPLRPPEGGGRLLDPATRSADGPSGKGGDGMAAQVAWFVLEGGHGLFERSFANRVFAVLVGKGLVEPLDDHRHGNPASHEGLLDALSRRFAASGGDLRDLVLSIVASRPYALSCEPWPEAEIDAAALRFLARREARPLSPRAFGRAIAAVAGSGSAPRGALPGAPLALQLGILNGPLIHAALESGATHVDAIFDFGGEPEEQLEELFLLILSRPPRPEEIAAFMPSLAAPGDRRQAGRDLAFALLASREFGSVR